MDYATRIAGVDEVGRGPLAGPVLAACVIIPRPFKELSLVDDSKKLTPKKRMQLAAAIRDNCLWSLGAASVAEIERMNILNATFLAMRRAVMRLAPHMDRIMVDGNRLPPDLPYPAECIIGGDGLVPQIACASIIAKVARDRLMERLAERYPNYGWAKNAGYGTALHMNGIAEHGVTPHHRMGFAPLRDLREYHSLS